jgi:enoyl-CoA hydratase
MTSTFSAPLCANGEPVITYEVVDKVAVITLNRPDFRNAQNSMMTYALDDAFYQASSDPEVSVIVLAGAGKHFSAGHDIGTPERDNTKSFARRASLWWDHVDLSGGEMRFARESEVYLGMCNRWRDLPKPTIAMVQGACIAGGLMLAWVCDLIVATDDAFFSDPVIRMGIPGVEYFAHPFEMSPRIAKEFLFTGDRMSAQRAYEVGMVNRVVERDQLETVTMALAKQIAEMPRFALALTKRAINDIEDLAGKRSGMQATFGLHQLAHTHNEVTSTDSLGGVSLGDMKKSNS